MENGTKIWDMYLILKEKTIKSWYILLDYHICCQRQSDCDKHMGFVTRFVSDCDKHSQHGQVKSQLADSAVFQCRSNRPWENLGWELKFPRALSKTRWFLRYNFKLMGTGPEIELSSQTGMGRKKENHFYKLEHFWVSSFGLQRNLIYF